MQHSISICCVLGVLAEAGFGDTQTTWHAGLIHYQLNLDCQPASYTISYSSEEPETQTVVNGLLGLPPAALQAALGFSTADFQLWQSEAPTSKFIQVADADCAARCGLSSNATVISFSTRN